MASSAGWGKALPFLAVGRVRDAVTLASYSNTETVHQREQTEEIFKKLLAAARQKLKPGQKIRLQWNDGNVCCLMDQQGELVYCVVTSFMEYPEKLAYKLLQEKMAAVQALGDHDDVPENGLNEALQKKMQELLAKYEDPGNFDALDKKIKGVKSEMEKNIEKVAESGGSVKDLEQKSGWMAKFSKLFNKTASDVRSQHAMRNKLCYCMGGVIFLAVIVIVVYRLCSK